MFTLFEKTARTVLPNWIYQRLIGDWNKEGFKKYFANTSWMFLAQIVIFITSFFTVVIVARYLGPENLGKLTYAQSLVGLFAIFASLGIDTVLYREFIAHPEKENDLFGTAILIKLFSGFIAFLSVISLSYFLESEPLLTFLVSISALTFLINPLGVISVFFNSKVLSKYSAQVSIFLALFLPLLKIIFIYLHLGIIYFAATLVLESMLSVLYLLYVYVTKFHNSPLTWRFDTSILKNLAKDSWPLMLAGFSAQIYSNMDQIMIQNFLNSTSVGIYSVATRLAFITQTFPLIIASALFPALLNAKKHARTIYLQRFRTLIKFSIGITSIFVLLVFIFAPIIVGTIFGADFSDSIPTLRIYIWSTLGMVLMGLINKYLVAENLGKTFFAITLVGVFTNVVLNTIFIPLWGISGAATATVMSYILMLISLLLFKKTRCGLVEIFMVE